MCVLYVPSSIVIFFFFNDTATTEIYTLSLHDALPIYPTYQAGLRRDAVQPDIEAERKKRDEIEAGKSYCSRRFGGATCDDKSAQIYARFDKTSATVTFPSLNLISQIGRAVQQECRDRS